MSESKLDASSDNKIRERSFKYKELYLWLLFSLLVAFRPVFFLSNAGLNSGAFRFVVQEYYLDVLVSVLIFIFPSLYNLIYGELPIERTRRVQKQRDSISELTASDDAINGNSTKDVTKYKSIKIETIPILERETIVEPHLLEIYLAKSQKVSDKIYNRAGAYLLIGCLIAFAGVLFFYFQSIAIHATINITDKNFDYSKLLLEYLPRIGTLIFVESIAFFFLRQYRISMEDFRYYDAIKRQRENQYVIFKYYERFKDKTELFDKLISYCAFNDNPNKLSQGESPSILEAEKVISKDAELFDKLIELVKITKK